MNGTGEVWQKGSLIGLAMLAVGTGISLVTQSRMREGIVLLVIGFGFIMWREYLKMKYQRKPQKK